MNADNINRARSHSLNTADLEYDLPVELIAQEPAPNREDARMLMVERESGRLSDGRITDLPEVLRSGDLLVLNDTKVLPAKFLARRKSGGSIPGLFVAEERPGLWRVMLQGSRRLRPGEYLDFRGHTDDTVSLELIEPLGEGYWRTRVTASGSAEELLSRIGLTPLPPYIQRDDGSAAREAEDRARYQTIYATRPGAIAAPTAGLHITRPLLDSLRSAGVAITTVTLHVGVGTFKAISTDRLADHAMHAEWYELRPEVARAVHMCRERGGRVVAVGTTSVRVLESAAVERLKQRMVKPGSGMTDIFIYPPYEFRVVDAVLTNFHLPRTTLLALVMAAAGIENTRKAYQHAINSRYRFYSFGDAMLIYSETMSIESRVM